MPAIPALRDYLKTRRSVTMPFLGEPGPTAEELNEILTMGIRVPDHGKLAPWRLIVYAGDKRIEAGEKLAAIARKRNPAIEPEALEAEQKRFLPAPVTVGVLSTAKPHPKIPEFEQLLSAGNVAFNIVHAAFALGFGAHWVTRWFAYDAEAARVLGAGDGERFVGFIHIGTPQTRLEERERPTLESVVSKWEG
jgi:nitroreductase